METQDIKCEDTMQAIVTVRRCFYGVNFIVILLSVNVKVNDTKKLCVAGAVKIKWSIKLYILNESEVKLNDDHFWYISIFAHGQNGNRII